MEIQLVLPEESQAEELALQRNDWEVIRYTGDTKYPYTKEDALADIRSFLEEENKSRVTRTILADGRPAGIVYFYLPWRGQKSVELGYWLGKQYWGQGIATRAGKAALRLRLLHPGHQPYLRQRPGSQYRLLACHGKAGDAPGGPVCKGNLPGRRVL